MVQSKHDMEQMAPYNNVVYIIPSLKDGELKANVSSNFYPNKSLYDILLSIASVRLKEKFA